MKQHIVIKLYKQLDDKPRIPYWVDFVTDKSIVRESVDPEIDRLMHEFRLQCSYPVLWGGEGKFQQLARRRAPAQRDSERDSHENALPA